MTALSLLLGMMLLIVGLWLYFPPLPAVDHQVTPIRWDATSAKPVIGSHSVKAGRFQLQLDDYGYAAVDISGTPFEADHYRFLRLDLASFPQDLGIRLAWRTSEPEQGTASYKLENKPLRTLWISTNEINGWKGEIIFLRIGFSGPPGSRIIINDFSLLPASLSRHLLAIYTDWTAYVPWNRAAMNSYTGVTKVASFYPVPLAVTTLVLSLAAYALMLVLQRNKARFSWGVVALVFLACWIALDLAWQKRLLHQLADTRRTFSGLDTQQKLAVGPDADLVKLVTGMGQAIEPDNARVIVSSSDDYTGLRAAYYLFPRNVFWSLHGPEVPHGDYLRPGDYVILIKPSAVAYQRWREKLQTAGSEPIDAEPVVLRKEARMVRVK